MRFNVRQRIRMPDDSNILRKLFGSGEVPKSRAWRIFREWGPKLRIDRFERLQAKFPKESEETIRAWMDDFDTVEDTIWRIAIAGGREFHSEDKCRSILAGAHPWMSPKSLTKALGLADYLAWHEGYHVTPEGKLEENQAEQSVGGQPATTPRVGD